MTSILKKATQCHSCGAKMLAGTAVAWREVHGSIKNGQGFRVKETTRWAASHADPQSCASASVTGATSEANGLELLIKAAMDEAEMCKVSAEQAIQMYNDEDTYESCMRLYAKAMAEVDRLKGFQS